MRHLTLSTSSFTKPNSEGLTFIEWARAANFDLSVSTIGMINVYKLAWESGENPTEYRAKQERKNLH